MAAWLFAREGLGPVREVRAARPDAIRWLVLSEWLCECSGVVGQSAWNAIYLMRIARGHCSGPEYPTLAVFRTHQPMTTAEMAACAALSVESLKATGWLEVAARLLTQQHEQRYGLLQRCGLRLEHAWYAAHVGEPRAVRASLHVLVKEMAELPASDKTFFQSELRRLPEEII